MKPSANSGKNPKGWPPVFVEHGFMSRNALLSQLMQQSNKEAPSNQASIRFIDCLFMRVSLGGLLKLERAVGLNQWPYRSPNLTPLRQRTWNGSPVFTFIKTGISNCSFSNGQKDRLCACFMFSHQASFENCVDSHPLATSNGN